jgi:hypothetical protein
MVAIFENGAWNVLTPSGWVVVGNKLSNIVLIMFANGRGDQ